MELSEESLKRLVERILEMLAAERTVKREALYVILTGKWQHQYQSFFESLRGQEKYSIKAVLPDTADSDSMETGIRPFQDFVALVKGRAVYEEVSDSFITVFPVMPRYLVAKTALGIDDTFETEWITFCFSKGQRIVFLSSGMESFTGKEPKKYVEKIRRYYQTVLEYGIEIHSKFHSGVLKPQKKAERPAEMQTSPVSREEKRVITASEVENLGSGGSLVLNSGDIVTALARDRAAALGVHIKKDW